MVLIVMLVLQKAAACVRFTLGVPLVSSGGGQQPSTSRLEVLAENLFAVFPVSAILMANVSFQPFLIEAW